VPIRVAVAGHQVPAELTVTRGLRGIVTVPQVPRQRLVATARVGPLANVDDRTPTQPPAVAPRRHLGRLTGRLGAGRSAVLHVAIDRHGSHLLRLLPLLPIAANHGGFHLASICLTLLWPLVGHWRLGWRLGLVAAPFRHARHLFSTPRQAGPLVHCTRCRLLPLGYCAIARQATPSRAGLDTGSLVLQSP
jgi:hypothetical protein